MDLALYREWNPGRGLNVPLGLSRVFASAFSGVKLVHDHGLWLRINLAAGKEAIRRGCRLVISPRGNLGPEARKNRSWAKNMIWKLGQRELLEKSAFIHATGTTEAEAIRAAGISTPIALVPNGIDALPCSRSRGESRVLLFLARIHPIKGVDVLLRAWGALERQFPEWELRIAGPDNAGHEKEMKSLARSLGLSRVSWLGAVHGDEKRRVFSEASLYVLPTRGENFGVTIAEALGHGLPVIVTKAAPWSEVPARGCGWWVETDDASLIEALQHALSSSEPELRAMGDLGREWMKSSFSWESVAARMIEAYRWALEGGTRPVFIDVG